VSIGSCAHHVFISPVRDFIFYRGSGDASLEIFVDATCALLSFCGFLFFLPFNRSPLGFAIEGGIQPIAFSFSQCILSAPNWGCRSQHNVVS